MKWQGRMRMNGFGGQIAILLRSEAKHPKGEPQARGIWTLTLKTQPALLGSDGVPLELGFASDNRGH